MYIGKVFIEDPVIVLAPMAGVTDLPFRLLAKQMGCSLVYSEMVSGKGLIYQNNRTEDLIRIDDRERPVSVQLFGSEPETICAAARIAAAAGADIIDINMGCPTPKIVKNGEGAALLRQPDLAYRIMASLVETVPIPVTVKIRKGWDAASVNAVEMAKLAERAGIATIAVHGRTREQFYAGNADWNIIREVKATVGIPVFGNGDVRTAEDAARMLEQTGCDGIMIGRGAQGNPWIFREIRHYVKTGEKLPAPDIEERLELLLTHLDMLIAYKGDYIAVREMRRHAAWYTKGLPHAAEIRLRFNQAETRDDFTRILARVVTT